MRKFLLIILIAMAVRVPLCGTPYWRTSDVAEYINVARSLNAGQGFTLSIKHNYFTEKPVVVSALTSRPVGTAIFFSWLLKLNPDPYFLQGMILEVGALTSGLLYLLLLNFVSKKTALVVAIIAAINPNFLITNRLIVSEIIFNFLVVGWFWIYYRFKNSVNKFFALGILAGVAYLVRQEGIFLVFITFIFAREYFGYFLLAFLAITFPYFFANWQINGSPFYNYNYWHFEVRQFQEGVEAGYGKTFPSPLVFLQNNFWWVVMAIIKTIWGHVTSIFEKGFLGLLGILLILSIKFWKLKIIPIIVYCSLIIAVYGLMWSAMFEPARNFILVYLLLLIPVGISIDKSKNFFAKVIILLTFIISIILDIHRINWARTVDPKIDTWSNIAAPKLYGWLAQNTKSTDIISSPDPMLVNLFFRRPTIITPKAIFEDKSIDEYVKKYQVKYFLANEPKQVDFLAKNEKFITKLDNISIFRTVVK